MAFWKRDLSVAAQKYWAVTGGTLKRAVSAYTGRGYTPEEIAVILGKPIDQIRTLVKDGRN